MCFTLYTCSVYSHSVYAFFELTKFSRIPIPCKQFRRIAGSYCFFGDADSTWYYCCRRVVAYYSWLFCCFSFFCLLARLFTVTFLMCFFSHSSSFYIFVAVFFSSFLWLAHSRNEKNNKFIWLFDAARLYIHAFLCAAKHTAVYVKCYVCSNKI